MSKSPQENGSDDISRFRAVVVAALRAKQLQRGSKPRIEPDPGKHKNTSIAVEEVRRGLITFMQLAASHANQSENVSNVGNAIPITALKYDALSSFKTDEGS